MCSRPASGPERPRRSVPGAPTHAGPHPPAPACAQIPLLVYVVSHAEGFDKPHEMLMLAEGFLPLSGAAAATNSSAGGSSVGESSYYLTAVRSAVAFVCTCGLVQGTGAAQAGAAGSAGAGGGAQLMPDDAAMEQYNREVNSALMVRERRSRDQVAQLQRQVHEWF